MKSYLFYRKYDHYVSIFPIVTDDINNTIISIVIIGLQMEVFRTTLDSTSGDDFAGILWHTSRNSETWLERRSNFTASLAMMSMAGYVLGLGDRHPSNLMLLRSSGRIVHIDFGDCFEVAALRDRVPEKIPFRLEDFIHLKYFFNVGAGAKHEYYTSSG